MEQREKLIELIKESDWFAVEFDRSGDASFVINFIEIADHLLANGVAVLPCRCDECEYAMTSKRFEKEKVACLYMMYPHDKNCFCSYGKRKVGD